MINPNKSNYLSYKPNGANVVITINGQNLENCTVAKYLDFFDNNLVGHAHVANVLKLCCQRIGMFKRVLEFPPMHDLLQYYNAFTLSCFSYCINDANMLVKAYTVYVRPLLEYNCAIWSPCFKKNILI